MVKMQLLPGALVLLRFSVFVNVGIGDTGCETVAVFKSDKTEGLYKGKNGKNIKNRKANAFCIPALVGGVLHNKEFLGFLCDARHDWFFGSSFTKPTSPTSYWNFTKWSATNNFTNKKLMQNKNVVLSSITAVVKENKIYALATIFDNSKYMLSILDRRATVWKTVMFVGTVVNSTDVSGEGNVTIIWKKETSLKSLLSENIFNVPAVYFFGGVGNGVVMKNGAIVFPVQIVDTKEKTLSPIIYSSDNGSTWRMGGTIPFYSSESSVTEFGNNKLLLSVRFNWKVCAVFETDNMGKTLQLSPIFMGIWENDNEIRIYYERKEIL